jgi:hypothetical protein
MNIEVFEGKCGTSLLALSAFKAGDSILALERNFVNQPSNKTLRIGLDTHQLSTNPVAPENFINHACNANAYIDWERLELRALRDIQNSEEITYNYFTSDWEDEDVFECQCGAENCKGIVNGFKQLSLDEQCFLQPLLSPFLNKKLQENESKFL